MGGWQETPHLPRFDPLTNRSHHPTIVQLCASDGDNTHVVCLPGDWIFDSNRRHVLPLCKASLDACCLGATTFLRVSYAARLVPGKRLKRERGRLCQQGPETMQPQATRSQAENASPSKRARS